MLLNSIAQLDYCPQRKNLALELISYKSLWNAFILFYDEEMKSNKENHECSVIIFISSSCCRTILSVISFLIWFRHFEVGALFPVDVPRINSKIGLTTTTSSLNCNATEKVAIFFTCLLKWQMLMVWPKFLPFNSIEGRLLRQTTFHPGLRHSFNNSSFDWQVAFITLFDQVMKDANEGRCLTHEWLSQGPSIIRTDM